MDPFSRSDQYYSFDGNRNCQNKELLAAHSIMFSLESLKV